MKWNFCPECGHRVYQHGGRGCEHVDVETTPCTSPETCSTSPDEHCHQQRIKCECTTPHRRLCEP